MLRYIQKNQASSVGKEGSCNLPASLDSTILSKAMHLLETSRYSVKATNLLNIYWNVSSNKLYISKQLLRKFQKSSKWIMTCCLLW